MKKISYRVAATKWKLKAGFGNHRMIVYASKGDYVHVILPWRRCDQDARKTGVKICYTPIRKERETGIGSAQVRNISILRADQMEGEIVFSAPQDGEYEVYYMPFEMRGASYSPVCVYMMQDEMEADISWTNGYEAALAEGRVIEGKVLAYESRTAFDSFYPMEIPMSEEEKKVFFEKDQQNIPFVAVAESRLNPVRMKKDIPLIWGGRTLEERRQLADTAAENEHYVFQIAVCAKENLEDIKVRFLNSDGSEYSLEQCICFNLNGRDTAGVEMQIRRDLAAGDVLPLWCGVRCELFSEKKIEIIAKISTANAAYEEKINITLERTGEVLARNGDDDLWRMSRLFWLNSDIGICNENIAPYTPVCCDEKAQTIEILGRRMKVGKFGLPAQIDSFYDENCQLLEDTVPVSLSGGAMELQIKENGTDLAFKDANVKYEEEGTMQATVLASYESKNLNLESSVTYECDGHIDCRIKLIPRKDGVYSFQLHIPLNKNIVQYMMGLGHEGGLLPAQWDYVWHPDRLGQMVWIGGSRAGLQLKLMPEEEIWAIDKNPMPKLWYNKGLGGMRVMKKESEGLVMLDAWTGDLSLKENKCEVLHFHLIITPFHPISYERHWTERYYHTDGWIPDGVECSEDDWEKLGAIPSLEKAKANGANIINLHQGGPLNENINYPFWRADKIKTQVDKAHAMGMRYKLYYTVRELSNYTAELWALRAFWNEILSLEQNFATADYFEYNGGIRSSHGGAWLAEHLRDGYSPAWHQFLAGGEYDCAIKIKPNSRWVNYYLEGLNWLTRVVGMDGLYLDGIGYDRHIMRRARRILNNAKEGCRIDIHCGNDHMDERFNFGTPTCTYMEHFAYADSLWIGEGYMYEEQDPFYFFTETSGIPFGLMGEMLQGGGNPWRGMVFGMTARAGWQQGGLVAPIWKFWDEFGMTRTKMLGYWNSECPVNVENEQIKATVYVRDDGAVLVAIGSWYPADRKCAISVNREALGLTGEYEFYAPAIEGFQEEAVFVAQELVPIKAGQGWMFLIREKTGN